MKQTLLTTLILLTATLSTYAQRPQLDSHTQAFDSNFKNIQTYKSTSELSSPIITLNSSDELIITFDELTTNASYLRYSLIHCNADWQPSQLLESEYTDGFNYADIEDFQYSEGTSANYVNYRITLPNENMTILKSGNYLLQIYPEDNSDQILLQTRFYVYEPLTSITASYSANTDRDYKNTSQQVTFTINTGNYQIFDARQDTKVYITQNTRIDNETIADPPLRIQANNLYYEHNPALIFTAGNEYRRFENTSESYTGMNIASIKYHHPYYHMTLYTDHPRSEESYLYDQTQYGAFVNNALNVNDIDTNSDYNIIHFSLKSPEIQGGKLYLNGNLTNNLFNANSQLHYNSISGCYEISLLLKQGAYNYQYLWVPNGSTQGYTYPFEGDKYQTINQYTIRFYHTPQGARYDRLIGYTIITGEF